MEHSRYKVESPKGPVSVDLATPAGKASSGLVIAHGAGNDMDSALLVGIQSAVAEAGFASARFNFPYKEAGRRAPDRRPVLLGTWRSVLDDVRERLPDVAWAVGGKSMGGRMASYLPGEGVRPAALWFLGFPLHPAGRPEERRDSHLYAIDLPMLFLQGTRDPLATFGIVEDVVGRLGGRARLVPVEGGDHSFRVRGRKGPPAPEALHLLAENTVEWLKSLRPRGIRRGGGEPGSS